MSLFLHVDTWINLAALSFIEIVMGVDNLLLIAIITSRLPIHQQATARRLRLLLAMVMRLLLLAIIVWLASLTQTLFTLGQQAVSIRDLVLISGGLFLLIKSIHELIEVKRSEHSQYEPKRVNFGLALVQIMLFDLMFSLDSVITAVGIVQDYIIMAIAIILAVLVMLFASGPVSRFIMANTRMKVLALCILFLVGIQLIFDGLNLDISTAYLFVAMGFAIAVELINRYIIKK